MKANNKWVVHGDSYEFGNIPGVFDHLPPGIYELNFNAFSKAFYLQRLGDKFELPAKVYDLEDGLSSRILTTFEGLDKNFGVLLKGLKGTGKTIVSKKVCNDLRLPVILVTKPFTDIAGFINSIEQDIVIFFDEFEKIYEFSGANYMNDGDTDDDGTPINNKQKHNVSNLLMLMDGVFTSKYKRLFLLTTNRDYLPDALLARPSRIRYVKEFTDLTEPVIREILIDCVKNHGLIPELVEFLKGLEIITVDIVKSIAEEANLYNTADHKFYSIFNVKKPSNRYEVVEIIEGKEVPVLNDINVIPAQYFHRGRYLCDVDGENNMGRISEHNSATRTIKTEFLEDAFDPETGKRISRTRYFKYYKTYKVHSAFAF